MRVVSRFGPRVHTTCTDHTYADLSFPRPAEYVFPDAMPLPPPSDFLLPVPLLPTGSEERGVLGVGSIPVAILPSCQDMETIAL